MTKIADFSSNFAFLLQDHASWEFKYANVKNFYHLGKFDWLKQKTFSNVRNFELGKEKALKSTKINKLRWHPN